MICPFLHKKKAARWRSARIGKTFRFKEHIWLERNYSLDDIRDDGFSVNRGAGSDRKDAMPIYFISSSLDPARNSIRRVKAVLLLYLPIAVWKAETPSRQEELSPFCRRRRRRRFF